MENKKIGETKYYHFYTNEIWSKTTGNRLNIYKARNGKRGGRNYSQLKKYEEPYKTGGYLIRYPIDENELKLYKDNLNSEASIENN